MDRSENLPQQPEKPSHRTGVILVNLGTPDSPDVPQVRRYLKQFLNDPYVIDIPPVPRWILVNGIILRTRPAKSAEAYRKIWSERGSPLLYHTQDLGRSVQGLLGDDFHVEIAMRYGNPSIESTIQKLAEQGIEKWVFVPLYPQYSYAATVTAVVEIQKAMNDCPGEFDILGDFPMEEGYLQAFEEVIREVHATFRPDHTLFSYHGIPERHLIRGDRELKGVCLKSSDCCATWGPHNRLCYRAQSFAGARELAKRLGLTQSQYSLSFQSRLGRTPWIQPFTDLLLDELPSKGVKRLAVACPSFVADCLETLEEIAIRAREQFIAAGGEDLVLIPSLNSRPTWAKAVADRVRVHVSQNRKREAQLPPFPE